jgi:hypothetical protein
MKVKVYGLAEDSEYDERNLVLSESHKHHYPSKKMFAEFLKQYEDVDAEVEIWTHSDATTGIVTVNVEVKYKVADLEPKERNRVKAKRMEAEHD